MWCAIVTSVVEFFSSELLFFKLWCATQYSLTSELSENSKKNGSEWEKRLTMTNFVNRFKSLLNRRLNKSLAFSWMGVMLIRHSRFFIDFMFIVSPFHVRTSKLIKYIFFSASALIHSEIWYGWGVESAQRIRMIPIAEQQFLVTEGRKKSNSATIWSHEIWDH